MKTYLRIISYARPYKDKIIGYIITTVFAVVLSALALYMLRTVIDMLFYPQKIAEAIKIKPVPRFDPNFLIEWVQYHSAVLRVELGGSVALLYATFIVVFLNLSGNIFKFLSSRSLGTIRTRVVEDLHTINFSFRKSGILKTDVRVI